MRKLIYILILLIVIGCTATVSVVYNNKSGDVYVGKGNDTDKIVSDTLKIKEK